MAHGPSSEEKAEPNLTSLLDVVLQLIMFFLIAEKAIMGQNADPRVTLPIAETAAALQPLEGNVYAIYLHLTKEGNVLWKEQSLLSSSHKPLYENEANFEKFDRKNRIYYVKAELETKIRRVNEWVESKYGKNKKDHPKFVVILRADADARYSDFYLLQQWCEDKEFAQVRLFVKRERPVPPKRAAANRAAS